MIQHTLRTGDILILSDEDQDLLTNSWFADKYRKYTYAARKVQRNNKIKKFRIHTMIIQRMLNRPLFKDEMVDHINGNTLDNRRENLRVVTIGKNNLNRQKTQFIKGRPTTSQYKGVSWSSYTGKWMASITYEGKRHHLGYFNCEYDAAKAYDNASKELHGVYGRPNGV